MAFKFFLKRTKIVSTFGPSITLDLSFGENKNCPEELQRKVYGTISDILEAGVNCVRYNFSHGAYDENTTRLIMVNKVQMDIIAKQKGERRYLRPVVMLADTKGPEIRVYDMGATGVPYTTGQEITVSCLQKKMGSAEGFSVVDSTGKYNMANDCIVGNEILVEDGKLTLEILSVNKEAGEVKVRVKNNYLLKRNKRINLPGADYSMDFLSEKDISDIKYAIDNGFEYVALSFANSKEDVNKVRDLIASYCASKKIPNIMRVYSKTETAKACKNLDEIIEASDGIMIARGDLGLEIPYYEVPYWTKQMIKKCRLAQKPAITATQMLDSLERNVVATRAEVSDVYRAAELGSDCTMLSGETAQGQFPVLAVKTMTNIVFEAEKNFNTNKFQKQFDEYIFDGLDSGVKESIKELRQQLSKYKNTKSIILKGEDLSLKFLKAISALGLDIPVFAFQIVGDVEKFCGEPLWKDKDYLKMKVSAELVLHRGISLVFVDGNTDSTPPHTMFQECFKVYVKQCCPECCMKNMLCYDEKTREWQFVE